MNFKHVDKKYRPIPFWSWNEKLDTEETRRQVGVMDEAGIGGYFMHARGGLLTEYMEDEWFDNVEAASDEGNKRGMHPWAYDENGWPSGFGGGKVNGLGEEYQQKFLHIAPLTDENRNAPRTIKIKGDYRYFYEVNEFYVDVLDRKVIAEFIDKIYAEYEKRCGNTFEGFFTDEPQISRGTGFPWSFTLPEKFSEKYGYDLVEHLNELFFDEGDYRRTRVDYWKLVTELFSENFFRQIYEWCDEHGYKFTGHLVCEESMLSQLCSNGACMPHYEYFHIPGMDWLVRGTRECFTGVALGSVAAQTGKKQVLSETFALAGHNVSHDELKRMYEWQMVRGVNLLCTHLEGYSLRGIRKRDYPPAMYYQQPWWEDMKIFFDATSRIGMILSEGEPVADTLLIHPQTTAWLLYRGNMLDGSEQIRKEIMKYNSAALGIMRELERKHVLYHLGDEIMMERHGHVEGKELVIGKMRYSRVIIPENLGLLPNTERLLEEFRLAGGIITTEPDIPENPITEANGLTYTMRTFDGYEVHYFVNSTKEPIYATFSKGNLILDQVTGETKAFYGSYNFEPCESIMLIDTHEPRERALPEKKTEKLSLLGEWNVKSASYNSITLDRCAYYFDGELIDANGYVLDILPRLNELRRPVKLRQEYTFRTDALPKTVFLCIETPELFTVTVNGKSIPMTVVGDFRDKSFKLIDIADAVCIGENSVVIEGTIVQSAKTYEHLSNSWAFESMKNSLSYDMEVEQIYIVGDFGARIEGEIEHVEDASYAINDVPVITDAPKTVKVEEIDFSGYPEFAGELVLTREIEIDDTAKYVELKGRGTNCVHLSVNGEEVAVRLFAPYRVDISDYLVKGKNTLELKILNNLRNMQGPLHFDRGDDAGIGPGAFFRESNVFQHPAGKGESYHGKIDWFTDKIRLTRLGLK